MPSTIETAIRRFIADNFLFGGDAAAVADSESLLEAGLVDSTGILELVGFLEETFAIRVADAEIVPDNLDSIAAITGYVRRKTASPKSAVAA